MKTRVILVGGFLGAGKTTLLWETAHQLNKNGKRVGLITNDQAAGLVDTAFLQKTGCMVSEVSGSCFCCNFNSFTGAVRELSSKQADVIIAEPVGSCTDLSATIMQPLKQRLSEEILLSPLTVLIDPERLKDILDGGNAGLHASAAYIIRKQLEEADIIAVSKIDLLSSEEAQTLMARTEASFPLAKVCLLSSKNSEGINEWFGMVLNDNAAGTHITEVDYDVYAEGEAVLGWLNKTYQLSGTSVDWNGFVKNYLQNLKRKLDDMHSAIGHVKLFMESGRNILVANLTGSKETLSFRGSVGSSNNIKLIVNARVEMIPENLEQIITEVLDEECGKDIVQKVIASKCLKPGRPNPTYRCHTVA
jgi:G3E family GTPase